MKCVRLFIFYSSICVRTECQLCNLRSLYIHFLSKTERNEALLSKKHRGRTESFALEFHSTIFPNFKSKSQPNHLRQMSIIRRSNTAIIHSPFIFPTKTKETKLYCQRNIAEEQNPLLFNFIRLFFQTSNQTTTRSLAPNANYSTIRQRYHTLSIYLLCENKRNEALLSKKQRRRTESFAL